MTLSCSSSESWSGLFSSRADRKRVYALSRLLKRCFHLISMLIEILSTALHSPYEGECVSPFLLYHEMQIIAISSGQLTVSNDRICTLFPRYLHEDFLLCPCPASGEPRGGGNREKGIPPVLVEHMCKLHIRYMVSPRLW